MNDLLRCRYGITIKASAPEGRSVEVIASTDSVDLDGAVLVQDWTLSRYVQNPVVLYFHNMAAAEAEDTLPIGYASDVAVVEGQLRATLNFVDEKASVLAERCFQGFLQGSLRAVSVGFRSKLARVETRNGADVFVLSGNELLEISVCPVPINGDAVLAQRVKALRALVTTEPLLLPTSEPPVGAAPLPELPAMLHASLIALLGLSSSATEGDVTDAVTSLKSRDARGRGAESTLMALTGAESIEKAAGVLAGWKAGAEQVPSLKSRLAELEASDEAHARARIFAEHPKKFTPALKEWAQRQPLDVLKGFVASAPEIPNLAPSAKTPSAPPEVDESEADLGGRRWEDLGRDEKHNLFFSNKALYESLKSDYARRSGRRPKSSAA